jgi:hypothetical protein
VHPIHPDRLGDVVAVVVAEVVEGQQQLVANLIADDADT